MRSAILPFSGLYNSLHDALLDDALNMAFSDDSGRPYGSLLTRAFDAVDWGNVHGLYARAYAAAWCGHYGIQGVEFDALVSPREYNFTTDRIFVNIPDSEVCRILRETPREILDTVAREMFTSRSGFSSFYSNLVEDWGPFEDWDHNLIGCLLEAYSRHVGRVDGHEVMEHAQCNGALDNMLFDGASAELTRCANIAYYLRQRAERKYRHV